MVKTESIGHIMGMGTLGPLGKSRKIRIRRKRREEGCSCRHLQVITGLGQLEASGSGGVCVGSVVGSKRVAGWKHLLQPAGPVVGHCWW